LRENILTLHQGRLTTFAYCAPFAIYILFLAVGPHIARALPEWDSRWLYAVQISAVIAALFYFRRCYSELLSFSVGLRYWGAGVVVGIAVFIAWINLDLPWAMMGASSEDGAQATQAFKPLNSDGSLDWALVVVRIFGASVIVPIMEELFWRSFILRWIDKPNFLLVPPAMISLKALAIGSILFGIEHSLWFAGILAGLAYAWLYMRSGNLWPPIIAHATTNFLLGVWVVQTGSWSFW